MSWRLEVRDAEKIIYNKFDHDIAFLSSWFLVRYNLTERYKEKYTAKAPSRPAQNRNKKKQLFRVLFVLTIIIFECLSARLKAKYWLFPHSRSVGEVDGGDAYVYPNLSEEIKINAIDFLNIHKLNVKLDQILSLIFVIFFLPYACAYSRHAFMINKVYFKKVGRGGFKDFIYVIRNLCFERFKYNVIFILIKVLAPVEIHFSDRSDKFSIILAARNCNVPITEYQHGLPLIGKFNYDFGKFNNFFFRELKICTSFDQEQYHQELRALGMRVDICSGRRPNSATRPIIDGNLNNVKKVMVLTQPDDIILREVPLVVNALSSQRCNIFLKPHPGDFSNYESIFKNLDNLCILQARSSEFYSYVSEMDTVVGFYSTALVEAAGFGKKVFLLGDVDPIGDRVAKIFKIQRISIEDVAALVH